MLVVNAKNTSAQNPTGMQTVSGLPLKSVKWSQFKSDITSNVYTPFVVVLLIRYGDQICHYFQHVAELANLEIEQELKLQKPLVAMGQGQDPIDMLLIDVGDNYNIEKELDIKQLPTFLMYNNGSLVYAGKTLILFIVTYDY
jgi:hypothetical protein